MISLVLSRGLRFTTLLCNLCLLSPLRLSFWCSLNLAGSWYDVLLRAKHSKVTRSLHCGVTFFFFLLFYIMVNVYIEHTVIVQLRNKMSLSYSWNPILISNFSLSALLFPVETETREKMVIRMIITQKKKLFSHYFRSDMFNHFMRKKNTL